MRKLLLLVVGLLFWTGSSFGQEIQIGTGDLKSRVPVDTFWGYSYSQMLYLQSEINTSGGITKLEFQFAGTTLAKSNNWTVYLGHTSKSDFIGTSDWVPFSALTQVFTGTVDHANGWVSIDITEFNYDNINNLVIAVDENKPGDDGSNQYFYTTTATSGDRSIVYRNDNNNPDPASPPAAASTYDYYANIKITMGSAGPSVPGAVTNVAPANNATNIANGSLLSWTFGANTNEYEVKLGTTNPPVTVVVPFTAPLATTYALAGIEDNTTYYWQVNAKNEIGTKPGPIWSFKTFDSAAEEGTFNGFVYDQTTNAAIAGASVNFTSTGDNYSVLTGTDGAYSTVANIGEYSITASAAGYASQTLENVVLTNSATVSNNFHLTDAPEGVAVVTATEIDENSVRINWSNEIPSELVKITQNPGAPVSAYWQFNVHGFGVVYNLADYPDAIINSMDFHHTSFGVFGAWDYFIHVYNWSDTTLIETFGPYTTRGNDTWEMGINLGDISSGGVEKIAIILQPQGHLQSNAYPCLSTDKQSNAQGSITGLWDKPYTYSTSTWGNFLMEMYIYTANGKLEAAPRLADVGENDSRAVASYDVWREEFNQPGTLVKITTIENQEEFIDNAWGTLDYGVYRWAVTANYSTGEISEPVFSNTLVKYSCDDFDGPVVVEAEVVSGSNVKVNWSNTANPGMVEITQNPGIADNGDYQMWNFLYGVAYNISAYPDATLNNMNFHHKAWGTFGTWEYKIHVYNWDNRSLLQSFGPFTTTGNDKWENVPLQDLNLNGASKVGIFMEPMGYQPEDAYPNLGADNAEDPQGSLWGPISQINSLIPPNMGNWVMNAWINTSYGAVKATPVTSEPAQASVANFGRTKSKNDRPIANNGSFAMVTQQDTKSITRNAVVGANVYRDGALIAEGVTGFSYLDESLEPGDYTYCVTYVYESGAESCPDADCAEVSITEECIAPAFLTATLTPDNSKYILEWKKDGFEGASLSYGDLEYVGAMGLQNNFPVTVAIQFDPEVLAQYNGKAFSKVRMFFGTGTANSISVRIWEENTLIRQQDFTNFAEESWSEFVLSEPVRIVGSKSYKVGYLVNTYDGNPVGLQAYSGNPNSDLINQGGIWSHINPENPYSWMIEAYVSSTAKGSTDYVAITNSDISGEGDAKLVFAPSINSAKGNQDRNTRAFIGYNVYRNGNLLNTQVISNTTYEDKPASSGNYCYTVKSVYSVCGESDPSNEVCVDFAVGIESNELSNIKVYPNPSSSTLNIDLTGNVSQVVIYNYLGQVVYENNVNNETTLQVDVRNYDAGAYLVKFTTSQGQSLTKKIVVNK